MSVAVRPARKAALGILVATACAFGLASAAAAQTVPQGYDGKDATYKIMIGSNLRTGEKLSDKIVVTLWQGGALKGTGRCTDQACPVAYNGQDVWARRSRLTLLQPGAGGVPVASAKPSLKEVIKEKVENIVGKPASGGQATQITRILRLGDEGDDVRYLQEMLNSKFGTRLAVDGRYGRGTKAAVAEIQRSKGLQADGNTGPQTLGALGI